MQDIDTPAGRKRLVYLKGAWDVLIQRCATQAVDNDAFRSERCDQAWWREQASAYAANGMRVLAVAQWEVPATKSTLALSELLEDAAASPTLQINCLLAILDPCRESAGRAVAECKAAGITVKMITGDHAGACAHATTLRLVAAAVVVGFCRGCCRWLLLLAVRAPRACYSRSVCLRT
jgi:magnesium-transporting ATPase (P-type)